MFIRLAIAIKVSKSLKHESKGIKNIYAFVYFHSFLAAIYIKKTIAFDRIQTGIVWETGEHADL